MLDKAKDMTACGTGWRQERPDIRTRQQTGHCERRGRVRAVEDRRQGRPVWKRVGNKADHQTQGKAG